MTATTKKSFRQLPKGSPYAFGQRVKVTLVKGKPLPGGAKKFQGEIVGFLHHGWLNLKVIQPSSSTKEQYTAIDPNSSIFKVEVFDETD